MTNPKHTSSDLVERLRDDWPEILVEKHWMMDSDAIDKQREEAADRIEALEARVAELEDIAGDLLTRFDPWSPHDHDAAKRARAALEARHD